MECLGCTVGNVPLAVAVGDIDQIVSYEISPLPPLAEDWAAGVGLNAGILFISVCLGGRTQPAADSLQRKGLLMKPTPQGARWALEVDSISHMMQLDVTEKAMVVPHWRTPQRWVLQSQSSAGNAVPATAHGWLDTQAVHSRIDGVTRI